MTARALKRVVVLISGRGSNMQALLEAQLPASFEAVISNVPTAAGLALAQRRGVATAVVDHKAYAEREAFDAVLRTEIDRHRPDLVVLAGFMRVLTPHFLSKWERRVVNVHPALCPAFPGMHAARQALEHGVKITGCTVHLVDAGVDTGPVLAQAAVPVLAGDDEAALQARIQVQEHRLLPLVLEALAKGTAPPV